MVQRICHVSTVHRGVEIRIARKQVASLAAAGFDAHLIIPATAAEVAEARTLGITLHSLGDDARPGRLSRMTRRMAHARRLAREVDADLYHFHDPELIGLGLALKRAGKKVVMDVHEDLASQILGKAWIRPWLRPFVARAARRAEHFGARRFDAVVAAYPFVGTLFEREARRVAVVRNFPLLHELPEEARPANTPRDTVAYVGGISRSRGILEAVQAVDKAGVRLALAGRFIVAAERAEVVAEPGWARVDDQGWVDRPGIQRIFAESFAGLCTLYPGPSHIQTEPIKLFEYMAAGLPVVVSTIPGWQRLIDETGCGLVVDPKDPDAIAAAITYLRDHPDEATAMGQRGRAAVLDRFNWDHEAYKLVALYRSLLG